MAGFAFMPCTPGSGEPEGGGRKISTGEGMAGAGGHALFFTRHGEILELQRSVR